MKLFFGILMGLIIFSSCSSNDDSNISSSLIIGIWKPIKDVGVCSTGDEVTNDYDPCEQTNRLTFNEDGSYSESSYYLSGNECLLEYEGDGTWIITNGDLSITLGDGTFIQVTFFELSENILKTGLYENVPSDLCGDGNMLTLRYTEYLRVE